MMSHVINLSHAIRGLMVEYPVLPLPITERTVVTAGFEVKIKWQHQADQLAVIFEVNATNQEANLSDITICCFHAIEFMADQIGYYETTSLTRYVGAADQILWLGSVILKQPGMYVLDAAIKEGPILSWRKQVLADIDWSQYGHDRPVSSASQPLKMKPLIIKG